MHQRCPLIGERTVMQLLKDYEHNGNSALKMNCAVIICTDLLTAYLSNCCTGRIDDDVKPLPGYKENSKKLFILS